MNILLFASLLVAISAAPSEVSYEDRGTYINGTASAFEKIIQPIDLRIQDPIHLTPAVVLIGNKNGDILRCLQEDPNECETFYETGSPVYALLITGEYFYAGLGSGAILRCELSMKGSCSTFHTCSHHVISLEVVGGYLYASLKGNSTVMRCELDQVNSCRHLHTMENVVYALISSEDHIYAGLWSGQLMRCSLRTENTCTVIYTLDFGIMGFANIGNSLIAVTWNGYMWNCTEKSGSNTDYCVKTLNLEKGDIWDIAAYKGVLYYVVNGQGIYICNSAKGTDCLNYGRHIGAASIAFSYSTYHMQSLYRGEHATCTWKNDHRCPPFVTYYQPQQRSMLEVHVKDGKLRNSLGNLFDTSSNDGHPGAAIFAMGPNGRLLLSNVHVPQLVHTSSLFAGNPVAGAGEMVVENGVITKMTTCSDHYRPDLALNRQVVESLRGQGYTVAIDSQKCCENEECIQPLFMCLRYQGRPLCKT